MQSIQQTIKQLVNNLYGVNVEPIVSRPEPQFGDVTSNVAMRLSKQLQKNPREISEELAEKLTELDEIKDVSVAGPGFINITLTDSALLAQTQVETTKLYEGQTVLVEYSDPNPFKPLHAGHLYTTLVGDTFARLIERAGATTIRLNYGGDVGLHVAKTMWGIISHADPDELNEEMALATVRSMENDAAPTKAAFLGSRYTAGNEFYETDETAKETITAYNKRVYEIHEINDHDSAFAQIYWTCRQWSYDYFPELYGQLQVVPFTRFIPESEVTQLGLETVHAHTGDVYEKSQKSDAIIFAGDKYGLHTRVFINSEGLPTYEAKDVGLSLTKWSDYKFDRSIIITATEQQQYMQVVIKSIEQFAPEPARRTSHLTHGTVKLAGGVKMSSRKGNVLLAMDILASARDAVKLAGRNASEDVVLAAIKYTFARNRVGSDIIYDPAESVTLEGNSGPYLQYAHARACSILAKSTATVEQAVDVSFQPDERLLLRKVTEYADVVERATQELMPHHICNYLYELSQEFNRFYEKNRVIGDDRESLRLWLVETYRNTLADGLGLLGIPAPKTL